MAYFSSYNSFRIAVQETQSTTSSPGPTGAGLKHNQAYAFSDASWSRGQSGNQSGIECRKGNMPAELFSLINTASFTSVEEYAGAGPGHASRVFYSVSPGITNNGGPSSNWTNPRNAIGLNFGGRNSLQVALIPGTTTFYLGNAPMVGVSSPGSVSGVQGQGGGNTGGGNTGGVGVDTGMGQVVNNPNTGTGGFAGAGVAPPATGGIAGGGY